VQTSQIVAARTPDEEPAPSRLLADRLEDGGNFCSIKPSFFANLAMPEHYWQMMMSKAK
jgi:hypothetical protein